MTIQRFREKPKPPPSFHDVDVTAVRYVPSRDVPTELGEFLTIARMKDYDAEVGEAVLPSGRVLVVRVTDVPDCRPSVVEYETVGPGKFLAYSQSHHMLYDTDDKDFSQFYDEVTE